MLGRHLSGSTQRGHAEAPHIVGPRGVSPLCRDSQPAGERALADMGPSRGGSSHARGGLKQRESSEGTPAATPLRFGLTPPIGPFRPENDVYSLRLATGSCSSLDALSRLLRLPGRGDAPGVGPRHSPAGTRFERNEAPRPGERSGEGLDGLPGSWETPAAARAYTAGMGSGSTCATAVRVVMFAEMRGSFAARRRPERGWDTQVAPRGWSSDCAAQNATRPAGGGPRGGATVGDRRRELAVDPVCLTLDDRLD